MKGSWIGKGKKSAIKLDGQTLEVDTYKYLGEVISTKNNTEDRTEAIEAKNHAATQNIITETGNKEFKGLKMQAIWQLFDATITPIMTYGSEGWTLNKKRRKPTPNNPQQSNQDHPSTPTRNPLQHSTGRDRATTIKIHHE